jgi:hypothetical protein
MSAPASTRESIPPPDEAAVPRRAHRTPVEELIPQAQELAQRLGGLPTRNRLKTELRIGAPKAGALLAALEQSGFDPTPQHGATRLHVVPAQQHPGGQHGRWIGAAVESTRHGDADAETTQRLPAVAPTVEPGPAAGGASGGATAAASAAAVPEPATPPAPTERRADRPAQPAIPRRGVRSWPLFLLAIPAFVAIWSGWVGLGSLTGFGVVHPLPGIWDGARLNTAITLPIGVETYAAYALRVWLSDGVPARARRFAKLSAIGSLLLGALGQVAYHLMAAAGVTSAPWWITTLVACLPVAVLGMGAGLAHLVRSDALPDEG